MDAILSQFSADELRDKCLSAVQYKLQHAQVQLQPALKAFNVALSVAHASKKTCRAPLNFADASAPVASSIHQLEATYQQLGQVFEELKREIEEGSSAQGGGEAASCQVKQEPTQPTRVKIEVKTNENANEERSGAGLTPSTGQTRPSTLTDEDLSTLEAENCLPPRSERKRKAATSETRATKRLVKDVVIRLRKRAEAATSDALGESVRLALNGAIRLEENENSGDDGLRSFLTAVGEAGRILIDTEARTPARAERHLEDMELMMSVVAGNLDRSWSVGDVSSAWTTLKVVKQVHELYSSKTKDLIRICHQVRQFIMKKCMVPDAVVADLKVQLLQTLGSGRGGNFFTGISVKHFDSLMILVNELLGGRYENWNPYCDTILGRVLTRIQSLASFQKGNAWNDRYEVVCKACSKMTASTFEWTVDLMSTLPSTGAISAVGEEGFKDQQRVHQDFEYVTSFEEESRGLTGTVKKLSAIDELVDRMEWLYTAVLLTKNQSLVRVDRLVRLNQCIATLVELCDHGAALNLERCIYLEKLIFSIRCMMYLRRDYAEVSKSAPTMLIGLFPEAIRPEFVYPSGLFRSSG